MSTVPGAGILVADDDRDSAQTLGDLLRLQGHEVRVVFDGSEAVELARTFKPGLAILDISMPVLDGYGAARALRAAQAPGERLRIVALTSHASVTDIDQARRAGFDHHLPKGVGSGVLLALVEAWADAERRADVIASSRLF